MKAKAEYLPDSEVDAALDTELRALLTTCFRKPQDVVFETRRYFREPYPNRWVIRNESGAIVAHIGVHEKHVEFGGNSYPIGGICEVSVHPDCRGRGYVKLMLSEIHVWLRNRGFIFAVLFGDPGIYSSSGYVLVHNIFYGTDADGWHETRGMVNKLADISWPEGRVNLPGLKF